MKSQSYAMEVNDRVCMSLIGKAEPYNIVRCIDIIEEEKSCILYFSLLRKPIKLNRADIVETHLLGESIHIKMLMHKKDCVAIEFKSSSPVIRFKSLRKRESYVPNKDSIRDGSDLRRQKHFPSTGKGRGPGQGGVSGSGEDSES